MLAQVPGVGGGFVGPCVHLQDGLEIAIVMTTSILKFVIGTKETVVVMSTASTVRYVTV
jgi:hypothetical protein